MTCKLRKIMTVLFSAAVMLLAGTVVAAAGLILGDADNDKTVTIIDVTYIQRTLAKLPVNGEFSEYAADSDQNGVLEITDATYIQQWLAGMDTPYPIGSQIDMPTEPTSSPTQPTEKPTAPPTQPTTTPTQPTTPPTQPATAPTQSTEAPTHQTDPTAQPTEMPTDEEGWGLIIIRP